MKRVSAYLSSFIILLCYAACKKDVKVNAEDAPTVLSCNLNTPTFRRTIDASDFYYDVIEDLGRNIIVLGKKNVTKYDYKGNLVWAQPVSWTGKPQNIIQADGDNYLTTNSTLDIQQHEPNEFYDNGKIGRELQLTSYWKGKRKPWCYDDFKLTQKGSGQAPDVYTGTSEPKNNSFCFVNKIDKNGNILWTKTFEGNYFKGQSICKTEDGNYAILTYKLSGRYQTALFDDNGVFQDTIIQLIDRNSVTIHKIDRDGNLKWSKTIDGIINIADDLDAATTLNWLNILSVQDHIFIQTQKQLFVLDKNGNLIKKPAMPNDLCNAVCRGIVKFDNTVSVFGSIFNGKGPLLPGPRAFRTKFDASGNTIKENILGTYFEYQTRFFFRSDDGVTILITPLYISKTDDSGYYIWSSDQEYIVCATLSCKEGFIYISGRTGVPQLVKTDRNGFY